MTAGSPSSSPPSLHLSLSLSLSLRIAHPRSPACAAAAPQLHPLFADERCRDNVAEAFRFVPLLLFLPPHPTARTLHPRLGGPRPAARPDRSCPRPTTDPLCPRPTHSPLPCDAISRVGTAADVSAGQLAVGDQPFPHATVRRLTEDAAFLDRLQKEILGLEYMEKSNDLYRFRQTTELAGCTLPAVSALQ